MPDNQNIKHRLLEYIKIQKISNAEFERRAGLSNAYMQNMKGNPTATTIEKILTGIPDINRIWLLTGEGQMLNDKSDLSNEVSVLNNYKGVSDFTIQILLDQVEFLKDQLHVKDEQIQNLITRNTKDDTPKNMIGKSRTSHMSIISDDEK